MKEFRFWFNIVLAIFGTIACAVMCVWFYWCLFATGWPSNDSEKLNLVMAGVFMLFARLMALDAMESCKSILDEMRQEASK